MSPFDPATIPSAGDSSGLEVVGPFPVAWNTPNLSTGVTLTSLSDGQIVLSGWAIQQSGFDTGGWFVIAVVADPGRDDLAYLFVPGQGTPAGLFPAVIGGAAQTTQCVVDGAGHLVAIYEQSPTVGLVDVYALVYTP